MRLATYNVRLDDPARLDPLHAVLAHLDADFVGLTEANDATAVATLAEHLGVQYAWAPGSNAFHLAALSRYPITQWEIHNRHPLNHGVLVADVAAPDGPLTIYTIHFLPYFLLPFDFHRQPGLVVPFELYRWLSVRRLLRLIRSRPSHPHAILGDFNAFGPGDRSLDPRDQLPNPWLLAPLQRRFRIAIPTLLRAGYVDCYRHLHPDADGFTWQSHNPMSRSDYIFAAPALASRLQSCAVVDDHPAIPHASDHLPLAATFA